jgi:hypothetical protein
MCKRRGFFLFKMPYKHIKLKIPKEFDKRRKLSDEDKKQIKANYGLISQRKLAKMFNVSRRTITFIGCPDKLKRHKELSKLRNKYYYNKEKHKEYIKNHRRYKQELYLNNKLI